MIKCDQSRCLELQISYPKISRAKKTKQQDQKILVEEGLEEKGYRLLCPVKKNGMEDEILAL